MHLNAFSVLLNAFSVTQKHGSRVHPKDVQREQQAQLSLQARVRTQRIMSRHPSWYHPQTVQCPCRTSHAIEPCEGVSPGSANDTRADTKHIQWLSVMIKARVPGTRAMRLTPRYILTYMGEANTSWRGQRTHQEMILSIAEIWSKAMGRLPTADQATHSQVLLVLPARLTDISRSALLSSSRYFRARKESPAVTIEGCNKGDLACIFSLRGSSRMPAETKNRRDLAGLLFRADVVARICFAGCALAQASLGPVGL